MSETSMPDPYGNPDDNGYVVLFTFGTGTVDQLSITVSDTSQSILAADGIQYIGYSIQSISGTFDGYNVSGLGSNGISPVNSIFINNTQGEGGGSYQGIDYDGISFTTVNGPDFHLYETTMGYQGGNPNDGDNFELTATSSAGTSEVIYYYGNSNPACYCPGTLFLTNRGDQPVETLRIGDMIVTASGQHRPIKWIGRRNYTGRFLAANPNMHPIRFYAGSLGNGLPRRDLLVSPEHAMLLDDLLIPARCLVNGTTIMQERALDRVDYFHIELDSHDILLAEGAPSESYLDDDSRGMFHNASEFAVLYPDATDPGRFCTLKVTDGYELEAIRRRLAVVAGEMAEAA